MESTSSNSAAFVHPNTPLRDALTAAAARRAVEIGVKSNAYTPFAVEAAL